MKEATAELRQALDALPAEARESAFWREDTILSNLHSSKDAWGRVYDRSHGGIQLNEKDANWVRKRLSNPSERFDRREMMLWAEMILLHQGMRDHREFLEALKPLVSDAPNLTAIIEDRLKPRDESPNYAKWKRSMPSASSKTSVARRKPTQAG
ncbi:hypothetical protein [Mesorhizobium sp.]|uniref:hypothetical protein n=1 Tax=Mesorhizobium sp. TaxID=1871066 RepID=UPI000FE3A91C|nr:hypothetical protein [Mesorhizobium sp.]RWH68453.1 MAG: hypothetical protein EOQ84_24845 [Mesorhizobium sp.]RWL19550.1 MAG: hypothetical protein EOR58_32065 [Mesorhizobium sp.]RWL27167.1 MAG: hypothetical protein EOR63_22650 [Mesorhizobium sp.]RWL31456.1 MAG: hypothetical protein EOR59_27630 [Mesorhizobium sp.]RWL44955.1 MAG: hypothetical protein EOR62_31215 [Mesorhizobium sp.]